MSRSLIAIATATVLASTTACAGSADVGEAATTIAPSVSPTIYYERPPTPPTRMQLTITLNPAAAWNDGTPIAAADFWCTWQAFQSAPTALGWSAYRVITDVRTGSTAREVVVDLSEPVASYRDLFSDIIKADTVSNCRTADMAYADELGYSGGALQIDVWDEDRVELVPNPTYWGTKPQVERIVLTDRSGVKIDTLTASPLDLLTLRSTPAADAEVPSPDVTVTIAHGGDYEAVFLRADTGPLADVTFRKALLSAFDRNALFRRLYRPLIPDAQLLSCGPAIGPFCENSFSTSHQPTEVDPVLTAAGWARTVDGLWSKNGVVPNIRWVVDAGDGRRINGQELMIPLLRDAGFNVVADNCDTACVYGQRLPGRNFDMVTFAASTSADAGYLTVNFGCEGAQAVATNLTGWCNTEVDALLRAADATPTAAERNALLGDALDAMASEAVLIPISRLPVGLVSRNDRIGGELGALLTDRMPLERAAALADLDGDGQIVIGVDDVASCYNPISDCADPLLRGWFPSSAVLPSVWNTTIDGVYVPSELVMGEPTVTLLG